MKVQDFLSDIKPNRFQTISKLSPSDIIGVWKAVSNFVLSQMQLRRGVCIPKLGTFSFSLVKLNVGNKNDIVIHRPIFQLSEKFAQMHGLKYTKYYLTGEIVISSLNYTKLSLETGFDRNIVESCVSEVLQTFSRAIENSCNVEFLFQNIGILTIKQGKLKMKFFKEFVWVLDNQGNAIKTMEKRPNTADSVMTCKSSLTAMHRPGTKTLTFPKLNSVQDLLPSISEDHDENEENVSERYQSSNQGLIRPHSVEGITSENLHKKKTDHPGSSFNLNNKDNDTKRRKLSDSEIFNHLSEQTCASVRPPKPPDDVLHMSKKLRGLTSACGPHNRQKYHYIKDLCLLCKNKEDKNIVMSLSEESKRKEEEADFLLMRYQQMKEEEAIFYDEAKKNLIRQENEKVAAFNLGVAEVLKEVKKSRNFEIDRSYIFHQRPLTPLRFFKQVQYNKELETQVKNHRLKEEQENFDQIFQERLEQVQLADNLAAQREKFVQDKARQINNYQKALASQICGKQPPLPRFESDSKYPIFGRYDSNNLKLAEDREKAREIMKEQIKMVGEKKKKVILDRFSQHKSENENMKKDKNEMIQEGIKNAQSLFHDRKLLEDFWKKQFSLKLMKEQDEKQRMKESGLLVLQQMDNVRRCERCQRGIKNCGESNLWAESRFLSGSRVMV